MNYRRVFVPGASYFFTLTLQDRRSDLLICKIKELRIAFQRVMKTSPFTIDGIVVLPEHMHLNYIHYNPVKHGHVKSPSEWPHSSIHRYINSGILPANWASSGVSGQDSKLQFGE